MSKVIGRKTEINTLQLAINSGKSELIAIYGRRRVGKTFLIRETYKREMIFEVSGIPTTFIFNENGSLRSASEVMGGKKGDGTIGYKKQVQYAAEVIKDISGYIQQHNKQNTIIIVAGDHGYRTEEGNKTGYTFRNLNAIYFPDKDYRQLYDSLSPVNTFRIVLNKSLLTNFALLKDSSIIVTTQKETIKSTRQIKRNRKKIEVEYNLIQEFSHLTLLYETLIWILYWDRQ